MGPPLLLLAALLSPPMAYRICTVIGTAQVLCQVFVFSVRQLLDANLPLWRLTQFLHDALSAGLGMVAWPVNDDVLATWTVLCVAVLI